ncbi:hypothetical protein Y027_6259 [Burkholderia pseudomallei TSV5]|nr:hypothetical protein Y027_6259 [Burkholderia pseudomallei TSV5]
MALGDDGAACIVQRARAVAGLNRQRARAGMRDRAARIVQLGRSQREVRAVGLNHAARGVVQRAAHIDAHHGRSKLRDRPAMVRQVRRGQRELVRFERAAAVVERRIGGHGQVGCDDRSAPIGHRARMDRCIRARADLSAVIRQRAAGDAEIRIRKQLAVRVVQHATHCGRQPGLGIDRTRRVVQRTALSRDMSIAGDRATDVRHRTRPIAERQRTGAGMRDRAAVIHQRCGSQRQIGAVGLQRATARVVERARDIDGHRAVPGLRDRAAVVHHVGSGQRNLVRLHGTGTVVECRARQRRRLADDAAAAIGEVCAGIDRHTLRGLERPAAVVDRLSRNVEIGIGRNRRVVRDIAALDGHIAVAADHTALCAVRGRACHVRELASCRQHHPIGIERRDAAGRVVDRHAVDSRVAGALDRALVVRDGTAAQRDCAFRHEHPGLIGDLPGGCHGQRTL